MSCQIDDDLALIPPHTDETKFESHAQLKSFALRSGIVVLTVAVIGVVGVALGQAYRSAGAVKENSNDLLALQEDGSCNVLWVLTIEDVLSQGWASRWFIYFAYYSRFVLMSSCTWVVPGSHFNEFIQHGLTPFTQKVNVVPDDQWAGVVQQAAREGRYVQPETGTYLTGIWTGESLDQWYLSAVGWKFDTQCLLGCWPQFDQAVLDTFRPSMMTSISGSFIGMHVRHGDKGGEGRLIGFDEMINRAKGDFPQITQVYLATDDSSVVDVTGQIAGLQFFWAHTMSRHAGGEPDSNEGMNSHHDSGADGVNNAIQDTVELAMADVMMGSFNSNFFRLSWLLGFLRRSAEQRQYKWCWDFYENRECSDRSAFISSAHGYANDCDNPFP